MDKKFEISYEGTIFLGIIALICLVSGFYLKHSAHLMDGEENISEKDVIHESNEDSTYNADIEEMPLNYNYDDNNTTDSLTENQSSQVPTYVEGIYLSGNEEWFTYYARCSNRNAFSISNSINASYNLNYFEINGTKYSLPMQEETFSLEKGLEARAYENCTEYFQGSAYGVVDPLFLIISGNKIYLQNYPGTSVINAVHIDSDHYYTSDTSVQAAISGISLGMSESEVVQKYGSGTASSHFYSAEMAENLEITNFQDTIYKNSTGILVVTYDDNRYVISITLYSSGLNHNK